MYYMRVRNFGGFYLAVVKEDHQTAKFSSQPNFPALQYTAPVTYTYSFNIHKLILDFTQINATFIQINLNNITHSIFPRKSCGPCQCLHDLMSPLI